MPNPVKHVPPGAHTITPHLTVRDAAEAIDFYQRAFGAEEIGRVLCPDGRRVLHAVLRFGDSHVHVADEAADPRCRAPASLGGTSCWLQLYVENVDAAFARAVAAGAQVVMPLEDMFWGDRYGRVLDPFGHVWALAMHVEDVPDDEARRRGEAYLRTLGKRER